MKENKTLAAKILSLNKLWEQTDKVTIAKNVEEYLCTKYPECKTAHNIKMERLQEISGSQKNTVYAWVNRSRKDIKVPFLKLCKIADALDIDVKDMLVENNIDKFQNYC